MMNQDVLSFYGRMVSQLVCLRIRNIFCVIAQVVSDKSWQAAVPVKFFCLCNMQATENALNEYVISVWRIQLFMLINITTKC